MNKDVNDVATGVLALIEATEQTNAADLGGLTAKQREVLDLLIQHKTSKEISRLLGISPHTVDQRIMLARGKLQVATRNEVAQAYRHLLSRNGLDRHAQTYQESIYGSSYLGETAVAADSPAREVNGNGTAGHAPGGDNAAGAAPPDYYRVLPEAFDGPGGTLLRLGVIVVIAAFLTLVIMGGLAIHSELTHMLDG